MATLGRLLQAALVASTIASLAACGYGSTQPPLASGNASEPSASWMAPAAAAAQSLLYVSDEQSFDVYVYTFPDLRRAGKLTGFRRPEGECSDAKGDVWITDNQDEQILRYHHGGTRAVAVLSDPIGYPAGCAIDPHSGDLAVTNLFDFSGNGGVLIYKKATGTPRPYTNPNQEYYYLDGYDDKGNLYVSGKNSKDVYTLSVLARGKRSMSTVSISGAKIFVPGTVQWTGSSLLLGDQHCDHAKTSCLYEATISGTRARITRKVPLTGSCDVAQVAFEKGRLAGGDYWRCGPTGHNSTDVWAYPRGGRPIKAVTGIHAPVGAAISDRPDL
jgi:hypothetical protein